MSRKHLIAFTVLSASLMSATHYAAAEKINVSTPNTSMVLDATAGKPLMALYYGERLSDRDVEQIAESGAPSFQAYPSYGFAHYEAAIAAIHPDGSVTLDLVVDSVVDRSTADTRTVTVKLRDRYYPFYVDVNYLTYNDGQDVIETWTEIWHNEKKPVKLTQFASGCLPVRYGDVWISHLNGAWANETRLETEPLTHEMKVIKCREGVRNAHKAHPEVMLSLDGEPREDTGRVIGAVLCYGGNYKIRIDTDN